MTGCSIPTRKNPFSPAQGGSGQVIGHLGHTLTFLLPLCHRMLNPTSRWLKSSSFALHYCHLSLGQAVEAIDDEIYEAVGAGDALEEGL